MKQISNNLEILKNVNEYLSKSFDFKIDYNILKWNDLSNEKKNDFIWFINNNYIGSDVFKINYTQDIIDFYCRDELIIEFFEKEKTEVIGYIIGKKVKLCINKQSIESIEVNFLCLVSNLRNYKICPFMKNILMKECLSYFDVGISNFTVSNELKENYYCKKQIYHRIINTSELEKADILPKNKDYSFYDTFDVSKKFKKKHTIKLLENPDIQEIEKIFNQYKKYCKNTYQIYQDINIDEFKDTFNKKSFNHFVVYDNKTKEIVAYLCVLKLETENTQNKVKISTGQIYNFYFERELKNLFNLIMEYIKSLNIFHLINFSDIFNIDYNNIKVSKGTKSLKYYLLNTSITTVEPNKNGLITI